MAVDAGLSETASDLQKLVLDCHGIVHVVRTSDDRLFSSLWELYFLVRAAAVNGLPHIPVCIVVFRDDEDGFEAVCRLAQRHQFPPRGSADWSAEQDRRPALARDMELVSKVGLTTSHGFAVPRGGEYPQLTTLHHGPWNVIPMDPMDPSDGAQPRRTSRSSTRALRTEALMPFKWVALELERPAMSTYDVIVKRER